MKSYLVVFYNQRGPSNPVGGGIDPLLGFLDTREDVFSDWMILFRQVVIVKSDADAAKITRLVRRQFPSSLFLVIEVSGECEGWLPEDLWKFLK